MELCADCGWEFDTPIHNYRCSSQESDVIFELIESCDEVVNGKTTTLQETPALIDALEEFGWFYTASMLREWVTSMTKYIRSEFNLAANAQT
jgi:hypothetical protein